MGTDDPNKMGLAETKQKSCAAVKDKESRMNQIPANKKQPRTKPQWHEGQKAQIENQTVGAARRAAPSLRREAPFLIHQILPQSR